MIKRIEQKAIKFIDEKKLIEKNDNILIALSGGPDSVFLLHFLFKFKKRFNIKIGALHINHKLRGNESDKDEKFCEKICKKLNVEYFSVSENIKVFAKKRKISIEEAGREIRYSELKKISKKHNFKKIATAHNSNDNTETVFLNLIKGTGLSGIAGIPIKRENIIRPILNLTKEEILNYLDQQKIKYKIDKSNLSDDYERNFLRNKIIPLIKDRLNPSLENSLFNSSEVFKNFLFLINKKNDEIINTFKFENDKLIIPIKKLKKVEIEFLGELLRTSVKRNFSVQLQFNDINKIKFLINSEAGRKVYLSEKLIAFRERDDIFIYRSLKDDFFEPIEIKINEKVKINGKSLVILKKEKKDLKFSLNKNREYISAEKIKGNFSVRRWKFGDKFFPLGMKTGKKLSDFLTEQKVSSLNKKKQLVLINNNKIIWVIGLRIDERFKLNDNTKKVYELCLI